MNSEARMRYYYSIDGGEASGPHSVGELRQMSIDGTLPPNTLVCAEGEQAWHPLSELLFSVDPQPSLRSSPATILANPPGTSSLAEAGKSATRLPLAITLPASILIVAAVGFFLWQRGASKLDASAEVQQLRQEIERLKAQAAAAPAAVSTKGTPEPAPEPADYQNFMRLVRRLLAALESSMSFKDYHDRSVDVIASAEEAVQVVRSPEKQKQIAMFALAVKDADDLWRYEATCQQRTLFYQEDGHHFQNGDRTTVSDSFTPPSNRWDSQLPELVQTYQLDKNEQYEREAYRIGKNYMMHKDNPCPVVEINPTLKKIFQFCQETFHTLEATKESQ